MFKVFPSFNPFAVWVAVVLFLGTIGCNHKTKVKRAPDEFIHQIDKIRLSDLKGQAIQLKQYQGQTVFINFWATWCKPCIQEMPSIAEAQKILQNKKIIFLLASNESAEQIEEFSNTHDYKFNYVRIENSEEMNVQALPATFIFNSKGNLVFSEAGSRKWNDKNNIDLILKIAKQND
jgi:thiol-disulfide isomerase/thioredoxin